MYQFLKTNHSASTAIGLSLTLILIVLVSPAYSQTGQLPDSLIYPEYRYYDQPIDPELYLIRPGEVLPVVFIGSSIPPITLSVGPEGMIVDQNLGSFDLSNKSLAEARQILIGPLKALFNCDAIHISVGKPYKIAVTVTGAVEKPGTYLGFTSQRISEIIEQAGGISANGSGRKVVFTGGPKRLEADLELSRSLASQSTDYNLYAGKSIFVPPISDQKIHLLGEHPRSIELMPTDNLERITAMAGGGEGATRKLWVLDKSWREAHENDIVDQAIFQLQPEVQDNRVVLFGGVKQPGRYPYKEGLTLTELLHSGGGLSAKADPNRVALFRRLPDDEWGRVSNVRLPINVRTGASATPELLAPGDSVFVPVLIGFIKITGQVRVPGYYPHHPGLTVGQFISMAGGLTREADSENISLTNRVTGLTAIVSKDALPGDGDLIRVETKVETK